MTLKWSIDQAHGRLTFGNLFPMTGNTYTIAVSGQTAGTTYRFYVMDESGEKCLARSTYSAGVYSIAFDTTELRRNFQKEWHECRPFHTVVSDGTNTIAEGDLPVIWNPVWTDPGTCEAYSMRGPRGYGVRSVELQNVDDNGNRVYRMTFDDGNTSIFVSPRGAIGPASNIGYAKYADGEYYQIVVRKNRYGEKIIELDQTPVSAIPTGGNVVTVEDTQTISGAKTFTGETKVPTVTSADDATTKAASTSWVTSKIATWWTSILSTAITFVGHVTASDGITGNVTGNLTGNVTGNLTGNVTANTVSATGGITGNVTGNVSGSSGSVVETRASNVTSFWTGTEEQYGSITTPSDNRIYLCT